MSTQGRSGYSKAVATPNKGLVNLEMSLISRSSFIQFPMAMEIHTRLTPFSNLIRSENPFKI